MPVQDALQTYRLKSAAMEAISTALSQESKKRKGRTPTQWREAELHAVCATAQYFAQQNDLRVPLLEEVLKVEKQALGPRRLPFEVVAIRGRDNGRFSDLKYWNTS